MNIIYNGIHEILLENREFLLDMDLIYDILETSKEIKITSSCIYPELKIGFKGNMIVKYESTNVDTGQKDKPLVKNRVKLKEMKLPVNNDSELAYYTYIFKKIKL